MDIKTDIESWFPKIVGKNYKILNSTNKFNCVAFTLDIYDYWIWTNEGWPHEKIPRNSGLDGFKKLYEIHNYIECDSSMLEEGFDKIAFYSKGKTPMHASKQFGDIWLSKLGQGVIIEHELDWLCGDSEDAYGEIAFIMKRKNI